MATLHLVADRGNDVVEAEQTGFLGDATVEDDLQQKIAEFVFQIGHVTARDGVGDLIGFLNRVRGNRLERLRAIPFAAIGRPEPTHGSEKTISHSAILKNLLPPFRKDTFRAK